MGLGVRLPAGGHGAPPTHLSGPCRLIMPSSSEQSMSWHWSFMSCSTAVMWDQLCCATAPPMAR